MRIGVVGTCNAPILGTALRHILPQHEIVAFEGIVMMREGRIEEAADALDRCDVIVMNPLPPDYGRLSGEALAAARPAETVQRLPTVVFTGWHPDCIRLPSASPHTDPMGPLTSAIAAAAYALGWGQAQALALFREDIYRRLGYFDEFAKATLFLKRLFAKQGIDIEPYWDDWVRSPFMHTTVHPTSAVLADIALAVAIRLGLAPPGTPRFKPAADPLSAHAVWPVYPEIARRLGVEGDYGFQTAIRQGERRRLTLEAFVAESYAMFPDREPSDFEIPALLRVRDLIASVAAEA
jgi:hypothetical protein